MAYTLSEIVHVDMRVDGVEVGGDFGPGIVELPAPIAENLLALGLAVYTAETPDSTETVPTPKTTKKEA